MDISQIITPEDAIKLEDRAQYQFYFELVQHVLKCLSQGTRQLHNAEISQQETEFIRLTADRLLYTLNALELRYLHIDENDMEIDVTASGYPNSSALRFLSNEISFIQTQQDMKIEESQVLIDGFIDKLMARKERISKEEIAQAAFSLFHLNIEKDKLHENFIFGGVRPSELKGYDFVCYWINYDVLLNRPFVSVMYFDNEDRNASKASLDIEEIINAVKNTVPSSTAQAVIYDIDKNLKSHYPKLFKRFDLGPLSSVFARDERKITTALREGIVDRQLPSDAFALEIIVEKVYSIGILETGSRFAFIKKKEIQNWSQAENFSFLMAPHNVIQYLVNNDDSTIKELAKHPIDVPAKTKKAI